MDFVESGNKTTSKKSSNSAKEDKNRTSSDEGLNSDISDQEIPSKKIKPRAENTEETNNSTASGELKSLNHTKTAQSIPNLMTSTPNKSKASNRSKVTISIDQPSKLRPSLYKGPKTSIRQALKARMSEIPISDYPLLDGSSSSDDTYEHDAYLVEDDYNKIKDAEVIPIPDTVSVLKIYF